MLERHTVTAKRYPMQAQKEVELASSMLGFDVMMPPEEMTYAQLVKATAFFLTVAERKKAARERTVHRPTLDRFMLKTRK